MESKIRGILPSQLCDYGYTCNNKVDHPSLQHPYWVKGVCISYLKRSYCNDANNNCSLNHYRWSDLSVALGPTYSNYDIQSTKTIVN